MPGDSRLLFDPFAGIGRIHELRPGWETWGLEIEPEWASTSQYTFRGDVLEVGGIRALKRFPIDTIVTSPSFGNRMADHFVAQDNSVRHTYRSALGRDLHENNSGRMQWGPMYRDFHQRAWEEVTMLGAKWFILNIKDHIRAGERQMVGAWHDRTLRNLGWEWTNIKSVSSRGMRHGANRDRVNSEAVILYKWHGHDWTDQVTPDGYPTGFSYCKTCSATR